MKAEIITVGTELLLGHVVNTNAAEIARMLAEIGLGVYHQTVVGDNRDRLSEAFATAFGRADVVIACGGQGPTEDDLTRETLAAVLNLSLHRDERWAQRLRELFVQRQRDRGGGATAESAHEAFPRNNLRQAMVPEGATLLPNDRGSAPGIYLEHRLDHRPEHRLDHRPELRPGRDDRDVAVALVPGPPGEMRALMREQVLPRLAQRLSRHGKQAVLVSRVLRIIGLGESHVAELLKPILEAQTNPTIAPLAQPGEMSLRITAHARDEPAAQRLIDETATRIHDILGDAIYGEDDTNLEHALGSLLATRNLTLSLAESCTGGLLGHRITNVPGSSAYFLGGVQAYSDELKRSILGVDPDLLLSEGAVSDAVARAMAQGVRNATKSDLALAITGIAGPGGGTPEKPVGLVWIALADDRGDHAQRHVFRGDRREIKARSSLAALEMLRRRLLKR